MPDNDSPMDSKPAIQRYIRYLVPVSLVTVVLLILTAAGLYTRSYLKASCEVSAVDEATALLMNQVKRYDDVYQVTTNASPDSVVLPVSVLQQTLMDTKQIEVPGCMHTAKDELLEYMADVIRAFDAYRERKSDADVRELLDRSETHFSNFAEELKQVKECAPYCLP